jgi:hypothetical protein
VHKKEFKSLLAQACLNTIKVDYFLLFDVFKRSLTFATLSTAAYKVNQTHACNFVFDTTLKEKWFWGHPIKSKWAGIYRLNDNTTLKPMIKLKETA